MTEQAISSIRIRQLEAFQAVAETGSFTKAAQRLGVSQPAVSRLVRDLTREIGVPLTARSNGKVAPTQEGRYLLGEIGRVLRTMRDFETLTRDMRAQQAGRLRIACLPGFATSHLPRVLADFLRTRHRVEVVLEPDRPDRILEWIIRENCDIGLTADFTGHSAVEHRRIPVRTVCILPPGHPLGVRPELSPYELADEALIHPKRDEPFCRSIYAAFEDCGVPVRSFVQTRQFGAACRLVAEGVGVAIVSELDAMEYRHQGIQIRPFYPRLPHNLDILQSRLSTRSLMAVEFAEMFIDSLTPYAFEP